MKNILYRFMMSFLAVLTLVLAVLVYTKDDKRANNFNEKLGISINFGKINNNIASFIDKTVGLDFLSSSIKKDEDKVVADVDSYIPKDNDLYETKDGKIISLSKGTVTFLSSDKNGYTMVIQYDNGITATYSLLMEVMVKNMDRVDEDDIVASASTFKVIFAKDGHQLRYEEFFA